MVARGKTGAGAVAGIREVSVSPAGVVAGGTTVAAGAAAVTMGVAVVTTAAVLDRKNGDGTASRGRGEIRGGAGNTGSGGGGSVGSRGTPDDKGVEKNAGTRET